MAPAIAEPEIERHPHVGEFTYLPLTALKPSTLNPRKHFDKARLDELAASMGHGVGIIEPLVVRQVDTFQGHYEIVAGERRYRAAKIAGLTEVPVVVKALTDAQVVDLMLIENDQRDDLNALEEATGFKTALKFGVTPEVIAERIGKSAKYVYDRIKLLDLIPEAKEHLLENRIAPGHAILIARLKPEDQKRTIAPDRGGLFDFQEGLDFLEGQPGKFDKLKAVSVRELEAWLADHVRFDVAHFAKAAPLDFGNTAANVQHALDAPGTGKKVISITHDHMATSAAASSEDERTYGRTAWKRADGEEKSKTCDHAVLGVVVAGFQYGRAFDVCIARDKCEVHWKAEIAERTKNQKLRESGQTKKAEKQEQRQRDSWKKQQEKEETERKAWAALKPKAMAALAAHLEGTKLDLALVRAALQYERDVVALIGALKTANLGQALALDLVLSEGTWSRDAFLKAVKPFKFSLGAVEAVQPSAKKPGTKKAGKTR